jgi:hypothetical protein
MLTVCWFPRETEGVKGNTETRKVHPWLPPQL